MAAATERSTRRGFLAGLAGGIAAVAAVLIRPSSVVEAAAGAPVLAGKVTSAGTASTILTTAAAGDGFRVTQTGKGAGVVGLTSIASGESIAVHGVSASNIGQGVNGRATATAGATQGVEGISDSPDGKGVEGWTTATTGSTIGVSGQSDSTSGQAMRGYASAATGTTFGVVGVTESPDGQGVQGWAKSATGNTIAVYGVAYSQAGVGVQGHATSTSGSTIGVIGAADSADGRGVIGYALAKSGNSIGVLGLCSSPTGWAGRFTSDVSNGVYISVPAGKAGLNVAAGTKNAVVATRDGARLLYAEEATEVLFADYGFGRLADGVAEVPIEPVFRQTIEADEPYHVFVQPYGEVELWVSDRGTDGFTVRSRGPERDVEFSYRIVARRAGYARTRLERAPWADSDVNLATREVAEAEADADAAVLAR